MIGELKPYSAYKESGVPWLGKVPDHWEVEKLRNILRVVAKRNRPNLPLLSITREKGVILRNLESKEENHNFIPDDLTNYKVVKKGQFAMNKMKAWQGSYGVSSYNGIVSPAYFVFDINGLLGKYLHNAIRSQVYVSFFTQASDGVRIGQWDLSQDRMKEIPFFVPPIKEQTAIASFLDYTDRRIRRYIRSKQKLIKLLDEQKQVVINEAVTRGINPDVPMKPSGFEWLGDIPEHWENVLLGRCLKNIEQGWSPVAAEGELADDQWAVLTLSSVKQGLFNAEAIKPISKSAKIPEGIEVKEGDFLLTRSNTRSLVGDVCVVENVRSKTVLCDLIYRLKIDRSLVEPLFLMYQLLSPFGRRQIEQDARGSSGTMPKIAQKHIKSWRLVLPDLDEQKQIAGELAHVTKKINDVIEQIKDEIALFREYRTRLISDIVTGKLDVREEAAKRPQEINYVDLLEIDEIEDDIELGADLDSESIEDEAA